MFSRVIENHPRRVRLNADTTVKNRLQENRRYVWYFFFPLLKVRISNFHFSTTSYLFITFIRIQGFARAWSSSGTFGDQDFASWRTVSLPFPTRSLYPLYIFLCFPIFFFGLSLTLIINFSEKESIYSRRIE